MKSWLRAASRRIEASYDVDEAVAGSHPIAIAMAAGSLGAVIAAIGFVPAFARDARFEMPWVALLLTALGAATTYVAWRFRCRGPIGTTATFLDNGFYSGALTFAAVNSQGGYGTGLAIAHGLMVLAFPAQAYSLTVPFAAVLSVPLVLGLTLFEASSTVTVILVSTYLLALLLAYLAGRRRELIRAQVKLTQAVGAASQVADESVQAALATTLLSLGHFLHELKNCQTAVRANLAYIETCESLDESYREALLEASEAQDAEQRLVAETIASLKEKAKPVNTVFLLRELLEGVAGEANGIQVVLDSTDQRFLLTGTPEHLRAVLTNLIRNSEQAGANVVYLDVRLEPSGQAVRLEVHDDGDGVAPELRENLFKPFGGTTKAAGTGLGLYLCRRYVELFGGTIALDQGPLGGAAFIIRLPGRVVGENADALEEDPASLARSARSA